MDKYQAIIHDYEIKILSVDKCNRHLVFEPICRCLLENSDSNIFYSITESDDELSLVIDKQVIHYFNYVEDIQYSDDTYKVIQIYEKISGRKSILNYIKI